MKRALTIGLAGAALAATLSIVTAWSRSPEPVAVTAAQPDDGILTRAGELGLDPIGRVQRRGPYDVLHAQDPRGREMRIVVDAQSGDLVSVAPVRPMNAAYAPPRLSSAPRIIHVPQPDDDDRADRRDAPAVDDADEAAAPSPPPRVRQIIPRAPRESAAPPEPRRKPFAKSAPEVQPAPASVERRTVLRAPPSPHDGPSPVRPTPRFTAKAENGAKFQPPPPPGYTPPANLGKSEAPPADAFVGDEPDAAVTPSD